MNKKEYNGWTNYETWLLALWLDNDAGTQERCYEIVDQHGNTLQGEEVLREMIDENNPLIDTATFYSDLINAALSEVNWYEIMGHYVKGEK